MTNHRCSVHTLIQDAEQSQWPHFLSEIELFLLFSCHPALGFVSCMLLLAASYYLLLPVFLLVQKAIVGVLRLLLFQLAFLEQFSCQDDHHSQNSFPFTLTAGSSRGITLTVGLWSLRGCIIASLKRPAKISSRPSSICVPAGLPRTWIVSADLYTTTELFWHRTASYSHNTNICILASYWT